MTISLGTQDEYATQIAVTVLVASGYLVATRRRSRRATVIALCGVGVYGLLAVELWTSTGVSEIARQVGIADEQTLLTLDSVTGQARWSAFYTLMIWAVLADRPA